MATLGQIYIFLQLQLDRIKAKPQVHAPGPKKPDLSRLDRSHV